MESIFSLYTEYRGWLWRQMRIHVLAFMGEVELMGVDESGNVEKGVI